MAVEADLAGRFEDSLDELGVSVTETTAAKFPEAVEAAIRGSAIGAALPFEDLSLADVDVTVRPTPRELRAATTGVTAAGFGIAEYGTVAVRSGPAGEEPVSLYPERHVAVLREDDILADIPEAMDRLAAEFAEGTDSVVFATGISATGDMGALVEGVHGPLEVHVVVVTEG